MEALEEEEDKEIEKEVEVEEEEGEVSMMDGAGKHFSTNGCKNKTRICVVPGQPRAALQVSHPSHLTLGCHLNRWCGDRTPAT